MPNDLAVVNRNKRLLYNCWGINGLDGGGRETAGCDRVVRRGEAGSLAHQAVALAMPACKAPGFPACRSAVAVAGINPVFGLRLRRSPPGEAAVPAAKRVPAGRELPAGCFVAEVGGNQRASRTPVTLIRNRGRPPPDRSSAPSADTSSQIRMPAYVAPEVGTAQQSQAPRLA